MSNYGFIITRHVNSEKTNNYWNNSVKLLNIFYPDKQIIIIDDNSDYTYVKANSEYKNLQIINSEYVGRGELLPYYYFYKYKFFDNAIIIHDSIFIHKRIIFEKLKNVKVIPLWHFDKKHIDNIENTKRITLSLKNSYIIMNKINCNYVKGVDFDIIQNNWCGCFGVQSYINIKFLEQMEEKYKLFNLLDVVKTRMDRCSLERIFGAIIFTELPDLYKNKSLFGDIMKYCKWGYTYDEYIESVKKGMVQRNVIKIWTGR